MIVIWVDYMCQPYLFLQICSYNYQPLVAIFSGAEWFKDETTTTGFGNESIYSHMCYNDGLVLFPFKWDQKRNALSLFSLWNWIKVKARKQIDILYYYHYFGNYTIARILRNFVVNLAQTISFASGPTVKLAVFLPSDSMFQVVAGFWFVWNISISMCCIYSHFSSLSLIPPLHFPRLFYSLNQESKQNSFPCYSGNSSCTKRMPSLDISEPFLGPQTLFPFLPACIWVPAIDFCTRIGDKVQYE